MSDKSNNGKIETSTVLQKAEHQQNEQGVKVSKSLDTYSASSSIRRILSELKSEQDNTKDSNKSA